MCKKKKKKETRVWLQISPKIYITKLISLHDRIIILLSFGIHWSFIFGHGWLHSNQFCKTRQNCFCPSWRCLRCMMAFAGAFTTKQQSKTWTKTVLTCFTKWLLRSHPWPNMNNQCTIWKKNKLLSSTDNNCMIFLFDFERFRIEYRFPFIFLTHAVHFTFNYWNWFRSNASFTHKVQLTCRFSLVLVLVLSPLCYEETNETERKK